MPLLARYRRNWIFVVAALFATPMLVQVFETRATMSEREARALAPTPEIPKTFDQWRRLPRALDHFLADHFGLRDPLVRLNGLLRYALTSPTDLRVVYGRTNGCSSTATACCNNRWAATARARHRTVR